jgi:hypothetical protein
MGNENKDSGKQRKRRYCGMKKTNKKQERML